MRNVLKKENEKQMMEIIDIAMSFLFYINNQDQGTWWLERDFNEKQYKINFSSFSNNIISNDDFKSKNNQKFWHEVKKDNLLYNWLSENNITENTLSNVINDIVLNAIKNNTWKVRRYKDKKNICSSKRLITSLLWKNVNYLRINYWNKKLSDKSYGNKSDNWSNILLNLLDSPFTEEKEAEVKKILKKVNYHKPNWEYENNQSLHVWAHKDKRWNKFLSSWGISYKNYQNDFSLPLWAIDNNWVYGFKQWLKESGVSLKYVPNIEEIPEKWKKNVTNLGNIPSSSLWHWACRYGHKDILEFMLEKNQRLLNSLDSQNRTGLHWACSNSNKENIEYLLSKNIDISTEDDDGYIASQMVPENDDDLFNRLEDARLIM